VPKGQALLQFTPSAEGQNLAGFFPVQQLVRRENDEFSQRVIGDEHRSFSDIKKEGK
jgi:hypothetical protein